MSADIPVVGFGFSGEEFQSKWPERIEKLVDYADEGNMIGDLEPYTLDDGQLLYLRCPVQPWKEDKKSLTKEQCIHEAYVDALKEELIPSSVTEEEFASLDWGDFYATTYG